MTYDISFRIRQAAWLTESCTSALQPTELPSTTSVLMTPISSKDFRSYVIESNSINLILIALFPYLFSLVAITVSVIYNLLAEEKADDGTYIELGLHMLTWPILGVTPHFLHSLAADYAILLLYHPSKKSIVRALVVDSIATLLATIAYGYFVLYIGLRSLREPFHPTFGLFYDIEFYLLLCFLAVFFCCQIYRYRILVPILEWDSETVEEPPALYQKLNRLYHFFNIWFAVFFIPTIFILMLAVDTRLNDYFK